MKIRGSWFLWPVVVLFVFGLVFNGAEGRMAASYGPEVRHTATFAGGCFWCTESQFQELDGVDSAVSGYAGGTFPDPTYEQVYTGQTDHKEAVQIVYSPAVISYDQLVTTLLENIDPTDDGGQFVDRGTAYRTAIYYHDQEQQAVAQKALDDLRDNPKFDGHEIVTGLSPYTTFYAAEEYHQDFYLKSPDRYKNYADFSGRKEFKEYVWGQINDPQL